MWPETKDVMAAKHGQNHLLRHKDYQKIQNRIYKHIINNG